MKASHPTKDLIRYLHKVGYLEICTEVGTSIGEISWKTSIEKPARVNSSLNFLRCNGLICFSDISHYGIRWTRVELNEKGRGYLNDLELPNG